MTRSDPAASSPSPNPGPTKPRVPVLAWVALGAGALALAGLLGVALDRGVLRAPGSGPASGTVTGGDVAGACRNTAFARIGGPFDLVDQDGKAVTQASFAGRPALLYFGFTYCPDICPMSLQTMRLALDEAEKLAGPSARRIRPVLISLDPERDTPEALKSYVASNGFPEGLVGLTGTDAQVAAAAKAFRVGYRKTMQPDSAADYLIDHTSIFYLLDSQGRLKTFFSSGTDPTEMGRCLGELSKQGL
jgi:protein SCO1/2